MAARRLTRWIAWIVGLIVLMGVLAAGFVYLGIYNVSAVNPEPALVARLEDVTAVYSVRRRAKGIQVPKLDDEAMFRQGFVGYRGRCAFCHGAPGVPNGDLARGLLPGPPELTDAAEEFKPAELFWITKNGIRRTGMPAWGITQSDEELWPIVAFLEKLPSLTPEEYTELDRALPRQRR